MRVHLNFDERYPTLFMDENLKSTWGKFIDLPDEDFKRFREAWKTIIEIEDKVTEIVNHS